MRKQLIVIGLVLALLVSWGVVAPQKIEAVDPISILGFSITIGLFGGSLYNYNRYPECRKEESIGAMGECIQRVELEREQKKERIADEIQK